MPSSASARNGRISGDQEERARRPVAESQFGDLIVGYGLDLAAARDWGLRHPPPTA
jgi:hypothetical protein